MENLYSLKTGNVDILKINRDEALKLLETAENLEMKAIGLKLTQLYHIPILAITDGSE